MNNETELRFFNEFVGEFFDDSIGRKELKEFIDMTRGVKNEN